MSAGKHINEGLRHPKTRRVYLPIIGIIMLLLVAVVFVQVYKGGGYFNFWGLVVQDQVKVDNKISTEATVIKSDSVKAVPKYQTIIGTVEGDVVNGDKNVTNEK